LRITRAYDVLSFTMKLDCKIRIQDRQRTNGTSTLKSAKGVIGLAKSNNNEWAIIVRLFKDTSATQYKVIITND